MSWTKKDRVELLASMRRARLSDNDAAEAANIAEHWIDNALVEREKIIRREIATMLTKMALEVIEGD